MKTRNKNNLVMILRELTNIKSVMKKIIGRSKIFLLKLFGEERASELEDRLIDI